jgi:hypothetical protein
MNDVRTSKELTDEQLLEAFEVAVVQHARSFRQSLSIKREEALDRKEAARAAVLACMRTAHEPPAGLQSISLRPDLPSVELVYRFDSLEHAQAARAAQPPPADDLYLMLVRRGYPQHESDEIAKMTARIESGRPAQPHVTITATDSGLIRYDIRPGFPDEIEFNFDPKGEWVRFDDVWPELQQLRERASQPPAVDPVIIDALNEALRCMEAGVSPAFKNPDGTIYAMHGSPIDKVRSALKLCSASTKGAQQFKHRDRVTLINPPAGCPVNGWRVWHLPFSGGGTLYTLLHDDSSTICMPADGMRLAQGERNG